MQKINLAKDRNPYSGILGNKMTLRGKKRKSLLTIDEDRVETPPTEQQEVVRNKFRLASDYAKSVKYDPELRAMYKERCGKGANVHNLAMTDYLRPPKVMAIITEEYHGHAGDKIPVKAYDLFGVTRATVRINDASGVQVESGECEYTPKGNSWVYTATADLASTAGHTVTARVYDHPGNQAEKTVVL